MRFVRIVASLSALSLGIAGTSVAAESSGQGADTTSSATAQKAYQAIAGVDRKLTEAAADVPASTSGADALKTTQRGVGVTIPTDPRSDVTIAGRNGAVSVTLPFSGSAAKAASSHSGTVTFDNKNSSSTTPIARGDGSTQINTVINDAKAPKRYTYKMKVPQGAKIEQKANSILVTKNGKLVAGIAPAWAKDAKGKSVPTHYEVKGDAVTQVVDHSDKFTYPVVADPWLGADLFETLETNRKGQYEGQDVYSGMLSAWGMAVYTGSGIPSNIVVGNQIIRYMGWEEWKDRLVGQNPAATLEQQYACHVAYGYAFWGAGFHWDLEAARPSNPMWDLPGYVLRHKCNWTQDDLWW